MSTPTYPETSAPATRGEGELLRALAAGTANVTGKAFFRRLVHHVLEALDADVAFMAVLAEGEDERATIVASWGRGGVQLPEGHDFALAGTPCEQTADVDVVAIPEGACAAYRTDAFLTKHQLDGYLAIVMRDSAGERFGYLGVMSKRRLEATDDELAALRIFASRAGAEVERRRHELLLQQREAEVAASRTQVVQAADEERRRIGRDLHDGTQQRLVSLAHLLNVAQRRLDADAEAARPLIARAHDEAQAAYKELQELARGLHPAGLAEQGLPAALHTLKQRSPVPLRIGKLPDRRLPDVLEVTIFFLVSEAVTNAFKHAQANEVRVDVIQRGRALVVEVADDGVGGANAHTGSGLRGLRSRVEALGGTLGVHSPPGGGTRLVASIPLTPWRTAREPFLEFGHEEDDGLGERLIGSVLAGEKTATISLAREWELEGGPPRIGQRLPVMDHLGRRHGAVVVERMAIVPFGEIDEQMVAAQTAGYESLDEWRASRIEFYENCRDDIAGLLGEPGWRLADEEPMVIVWFKLDSR